MPITHLSLGNQQLLEHVLLWAAVPMDLASANPMISVSTPPSASARVLVARTETHLARLVEAERKLISPLHIPARELNGNFSELPNFRKNLLDASLAWKENSDWATWVIDDIWQLHASVLGLSQKIRLMRSGLTALGNHVPRVAGLANYLNWSQEFLESRSQHARHSVEHSSHGARAVSLFYDSTERAAHNMMRGAQAATHYFEKR